MKYLFITFAIFSSNAWAGGFTLVRDPLKHARTFATEFSVGDDNVSGFVSCKYLYREDQGFTRAVTCEGTRKLLVHGGHLVESPFNCDFEYLMSIYGGFEVVSAGCN